ncbi:hypothetical protein AA0535_2358 [Asaia krungthepensis NRIC 0535]|uniref:Uncharacterized protein n=1 Tax=Asaia krungthepensis NRIC 0535 TaxID=1307925 RepID=A0ABQ0Q521_9PROT|nr:hypothetical protein AA0535_2358 [Asaia krungthepensis NRIC 0535]
MFSFDDRGSPTPLARHGALNFAKPRLILCRPFGKFPNSQVQDRLNASLRCNGELFSGYSPGHEFKNGLNLSDRKIELLVAL